MVHTPDKLRADARANRARLLEVAREALAADPDASLNAIAKSAGVGGGTLYRHFPSREALVLGVYRQEIEALVDLAPTLLAEHPPLQAFRRWCDRLAEYGRIKHGIADVLRRAMTSVDVQETYGPMVGALRQLIQACEAAGDLYPGADAEDLLLILTFLWQIPPGAAGEAQAGRLLDLIFRGLEAGDRAAPRRKS